MTDQRPSELSTAQRDTLARAAEEFGTPCYVYFWNEVEARSREIYDAFGGRFDLSYAVKCNPNAELLKRIRPLSPLLDVSSGGELALALDCGYPAEQISFSGPGKTLKELDLALARGCGKLIVENEGELDDLERLARAGERQVDILLRVNPKDVPKGFGVNMSGRPCQFGFDEEVVDETLARLDHWEHLRFQGFHIYAGTQCLDAKAIADNIQNYLRIFRMLTERHGLAPNILIFGSGFGIPYHDRDSPLDLPRAASRINPLLDDLRAHPAFAKSRLVLELGRYLVGEAGYYVTRVTRTKESRGKKIGICDGGLNHHLAACGLFGSVIRRNYRMWKIAPRPAGGAHEPEKVELFGPLCTTIDQLAHNVSIVDLQPGDAIAIASSGGYGLSASPTQFISHAPPREVLAYSHGNALELEDISQH